MPAAASAIRVRSARPDEIELVRGLAERIWRAHYPGIIAPEQIDYMLARGYAPEVLARFLKGDDRGLLLALADQAPAGFAAWYSTDTPAQAKLDKLYVLPSHQGRGAGRALIAQVEALARGRGATALILNVNKRNAQAIRAYERYGFALDRAEIVDIGSGFVMDDYVLRKAL